jgi:hypothetical protein
MGKKTVLLISFFILTFCNSTYAQVWVQANTDGFGDFKNERSHIGAVYNGYLYYGTLNRHAVCEVWKYDGITWTQVNADGFGDANNEYASGGVVYDGCLYMGTTNRVTGCEVWKYDGVTWTQMNTDGFGDVNNIHVSGGVVYEDSLYMRTRNPATGCEVWKYNGSEWLQVNIDGFGDPNSIGGWIGDVYENRLYVGTYNDVTGGEVWEYDGSTWTQVNADGFGDANNIAVWPSRVYQNHLYAGTRNDVTGGEVWEYDGATWTQVNTDGFGDPNNTTAFPDGLYFGYLYCGTGNLSTGGEVWEYNGSTWTQVNTDGFGDTNNIAADAGVVYDGRFYVSTRNILTGTEIWSYETTAVVSPPLDIKPGSCPNPLNVKAFQNPPDPRLFGNLSHGSQPNQGGVLPVAVLGAIDFDVHDVDVSSLLLQGVAPLRHSYQDIAAPVEDGEECECTTAGSDGYMDLTLKFQKSEIAAALGPVSDGDVIALTIKGQLNDGTHFEGIDCVVIRDKKPSMLDLSGPDEVVLHPAVPNPFNPGTKITFSIDRDALAVLSIYDVAGRLVRTLVNRRLEAGSYAEAWDGRDTSGDEVASGIYFYRLTAGNRTLTKKMVLIR